MSDSSTFGTLESLLPKPEPQTEPEQAQPITVVLTPAWDLPPKQRKGRTRKGESNTHLGARTKHEPIRRPFFDDDKHEYKHRSPRAAIEEDTPELRSAVAERSLIMCNAFQEFENARKAFLDLGALPDSILKDLPRSVTRHMQVYQHKLVQTNHEKPVNSWAQNTSHFKQKRRRMD